MIKEVIEAAILVIGGGGTAFGIYTQFHNRHLTSDKLSSEISLDKATESKIVRDAAHSVEQDYLNRLTDFRVEIERLNKELNHERERAAESRDRLVLLEDFFFNKHMPWDRRMCVVAREHDWEIDDPPSVMNYLREMQEQLDSKQREEHA